MIPEERENRYGNAWLLTNEAVRLIPSDVQSRAQDAGLFSVLHMIIMKAIRAFFSPLDRDHYEDIIGYARLAIGHLEKAPPVVKMTTENQLHWSKEDAAAAVAKAKEIMNADRK